MRKAGRLSIYCVCKNISFAIAAGGIRPALLDAIYFLHVFYIWLASCVLHVFYMCFYMCFNILFLHVFFTCVFTCAFALRKKAAIVSQGPRAKEHLKAAF